MPYSESASQALPPLEACEERIGYQFTNRQLLLTALTHASGASHRLSSNERLEFLGDAILGSIVCERLFHDFPEHLEGDLTTLKSVVVSRKVCAKISRALALEEFVLLGKGMTTSEKVPSSVLAALFEALVAAIFLDGGRTITQQWVERFVVPEIEMAVAGELGRNYKSQLQQQAQREHGVTPNYRLLEERGPDHSKSFQVAVEIGKQRFTPAWGDSKKEAEQRAAANALCDLNGEPLLYTTELEAAELDAEGASNAPPAP